MFNSVQLGSYLPYVKLEKEIMKVPGYKFSYYSGLKIW